MEKGSLKSVCPAHYLIVRVSDPVELACAASLLGIAFRLQCRSTVGIMVVVADDSALEMALVRKGLKVVTVVVAMDSFLKGRSLCSR